MKTSTHIIIGLTSGFISGVININYPTATIFITCVTLILSSILPDINIPLEHIGFTHSILFGVILSTLIFFIYPNILVAFLLGFYLHLLADMFTNSNVQLFFPYKGKIGFDFMKYDNPTEIVIQYCCILIMGVLFWHQVPNYYRSLFSILVRN